VSISRDSRAEKKLKAARRAQFGLKQKFERIDWEEDDLYPEVAELKSGNAIFNVTAENAFDIAGIPAGSNPPDESPSSSDKTWRYVWRKQPPQ
jgi:hypothetical protein